MKNIVLFLLFSTLSIAQPTGTGIEVRLEEGAAVDAGFMAILQNYQVQAFQPKAGHPVFQNRAYQISAAGDLNGLLADLLSYTAVVEDAFIADASYFNDACQAKLVSSDIGIPVTIENGTVVTNDEGLNVIFGNFNVYYQSQSYPSSTVESTLRVYDLACDCDAASLIAALNAYSEVIENTNPMSAAYLSNDQFAMESVKVYPNPFSSGLTIESAVEISSYQLADLTGKVLFMASDQAAFDSELRNLSSGIYILRLASADNASTVRKIVKS